jgi:hypothetical protein
MLGLLVIQLCPEDFAGDADTLLPECKIKLMEMATQDIIILAQNSTITPDEKEWIIHTYTKIHSVTFKQRLEKYIKAKNGLEENQTKKVLMFTYSQRLESELKDQYQNEVVHKSISTVKSELDTTKQIQKFYESGDELVLIFDLHYASDSQHLSFLKFLVDKVEKEASASLKWGGTKTIIIMVHLQRNFNEGS